MDDPTVYRAALCAFEDAEQARAFTAVTLYADMELERVLRGPRKGQDLGDALDAEVRGMESRCGLGILRSSVVRPWWTCWRPVWLLLLIPPDVLP